METHEYVPHTDSAGRGSLANYLAPIGIMILLAFTNPTTESFARHLSGGIRIQGQPVYQSAVSDMKKQGILRRDDYIVFSLFYIRGSFLGIGVETRILGIAGQFITLR